MLNILNLLYDQYIIINTNNSSSHLHTYLHTCINKDFNTSYIALCISTIVARISKKIKRRGTVPSDRSPSEDNTPRTLSTIHREQHQ